MIKSVKVINGCISCRNCENVCPKIFEVSPKSKVISNNFLGNETEILMAEAMCPVNVIKVDKKNGVSLNFKESKLISKKYLTSDIIELIFEKTDNFLFKPGQYISIMFEDWRGKFSRQYSIADVFDDKFSLTIKLGEKGRGAKKIKKMKDGQKIKFLGPLGNFYLQNNKKEKYFISTGTGLAPFITMGKNTEKDVKKHYIIGASKKEDLYYLDEIDKIPNSQKHIFISREKIDGYYNGRVTDFLDNIPKENSEIYLCGNPPMVSEVLSILKGKGYKDENLFSEGFTSSGKNESIFYEIFRNGNIPFVNKISWGIIFLAFILAIGYILKYGNGTLYDKFFIFSSYQNLIFNISWFSVVFVMIIRPLSDIFPKNNFLRKLKSFRKSFGILSSLLIFVNFASKYFYNPASFVNYLNPNRWSDFIAILSRTTEVTAIILLLTSNTFSQKALGKFWKIIQYLSYPYFISGALVAGLYITGFWGNFQYYGILGIWIILYIIALFLNYIRRKKDIS